MWFGECGNFPLRWSSKCRPVIKQNRIELEKQGIGNLMCTAGIGARAPGLMKSAEASDRIITIDGCPVNCASKTLELVGFKVDKHIVISELGIKKSKDRDLKDNEIFEVLEKTLKILQSE
jgi:uncharacterized metal-binding protein